jgi:hypothetical protein
MTQDFYVSVQTQDFSVTTETERVAQVTAVGIQGLPGGSTINFEDIPNVEAENAQDGSVLVLDAPRNKWVATRILEKQDITGGQY